MEERMQLTEDDLEMLKEGLDALLKSKEQNGMFSALVEGVLIRGCSEEEAISMMDDQMDKARAERAKIEDRVTLLKAKIILLSDKLLVGELVTQKGV